MTDLTMPNDPDSKKFNAIMWGITIFLIGHLISAGVWSYLHWEIKKVNQHIDRIENGTSSVVIMNINTGKYERYIAIGTAHIRGDGELKDENADDSDLPLFPVFVSEKGYSNWLDHLRKEVIDMSEKRKAEEAAKAAQQKVQPSVQKVQS